MIKYNTLFKFTLPIFLGMSIAYASDDLALLESEYQVMGNDFPIQEMSAHWAEALNAHDAHDVDKILALYNNIFVLYPTFNLLINTEDELRAYFVALTKKEDLKVVFNSENIRVGEAAAVNSGLYTFSYNEKGALYEIPARFTFVYILTPNGWKIIDHHSSVSP